MARTVLEVARTFDDRMTIKLRHAPVEIANALMPHQFLCTPEELAETAHQEASWVRSYGHALWAALSDEGAISLALERLLETPAGQESPLIFELLDAEAERFHWETLCDDQDHFLALDGRWPICRIPFQLVEFRSGRKYTPPLRVMAVLSAYMVSAQREWEGLNRAFADHAAKGVPLRLHVLVSEPALFERIKEEAGVDPQGRALYNGGSPWLSVGKVPDRRADLLQQAKGFGPHILHLFCHGRASSGQPTLEIATPNDWEDTREARSPLLLEIEWLSNCGILPKLWLAVLNCCESGAATAEVHSLTAKLVANGLPAAVGMREPIPHDAATEFSRTFYAALLPDLIERLDEHNEPGERIELDWGRLLGAPRGALSEQYDNDPASHQEWTLPVLYVARGDLTIERRPAPPGAEVHQAETLARAIDHMPAEATPPAALIRLREAIEGEDRP